MNIWKLYSLVIALFFTLLINGCGTSGAGGQPMMQDALGKLRAAKSELEAAAPNKGGHREKAIEIVDRAINQVNDGIAFAAK